MVFVFVVFVGIQNDNDNGNEWEETNNYEYSTQKFHLVVCALMQ